MKLTFSLAAFAACTCLMPLASSPHARAQSLPRELPAPTKADETDDTFVWVIAPAVGSRWQMRTFTRTESNSITPSITGQKAARVQSVVLQRLVADYDVLGRDQFGATTTRITFRDMDIDATMKINGKPQPVADGSADKLRGAIRGATFIIKQAPDGAVWNIIGLEALQRRFVNALSEGDPVARQQIQKMSQSLFSPAAARKMMAQSGALPAYPIRAGESWAYAVELPLALPMRSKIVGTRTINLLTPDAVFISDTAIYSGGTSEAPMDAGNGNRMTYDMSGIEGGLLGTSRIDRTSGMTMESTLAQRLGGAMTFRQLDFVGRIKSAESVPIDVVTTGRVVLQPRS